MKSTPIATLCLVPAALLPAPSVYAQNPAPLTIEAIGLDGEAATGINISEAIDTFRLTYGEAPGERTVFFVQLTLDETNEDIDLTFATALAMNYPFLLPPEQIASSLCQPPNTTITNPLQTVEILYAQYRVLNHLQSAIASLETTNRYAETNNAGGASTASRIFPLSASPHIGSTSPGAVLWDERYAWHQAGTLAGPNSTRLFHIDQLGLMACIQGALALQHYSTLMPPNMTQLNALFSLCKEYKVLFALHIQAAHITPGTGGGNAQIRWSRPVHIRKRSLMAQAEPGPLPAYMAAFGGNMPLWAPWLLGNPGERMYFGPHNGQLTLEVSHPHANLRIHIPTYFGEVNHVDQVGPAEAVIDRRGNPEVATVVGWLVRFPYPPESMMGLVSIETAPGDTHDVSIVGGSLGGAIVFPFDPPE